MNKVIRSTAALFLAVLLLLTLSACGGASVKQAEVNPSVSPKPVERTEMINIPESVLKRLNLDITALSRRLELYNVTENIDGSCTVYMTAEEKEAILSTLCTALNAEMDALPESGTWPFLIKVEISADGTKATLYTTAESYDPIRDRTAAESIYLPALLYAAFTSEDAESFTLQITVVDEAGKEIDAYVYPQSDPTPSPETSATE